MLYPSPLQPQPIITAGKRGPARLESQCFFHQKNRDAAWPFTLDHEDLRHEAAKPIEGMHTLVLKWIPIFPYAAEPLAQVAHAFFSPHPPHPLPCTTTLPRTLTA